jgi:hypothetical protein
MHRDRQGHGWMGRGDHCFVGGHHPDDDSLNPGDCFLDEPLLLTLSFYLAFSGSLFRRFF